MEKFVSHSMPLATLKGKQAKKQQEVIVLPNSEDFAELEEALVKTKLIDWSTKFIVVPYCDRLGRQCLMRAVPRIPLTFLFDGPSTAFIYRKERKPFENVKCPKGMHFAPVKPEHVTQINGVWPHRWDGSEWIFHNFIKSKHSYGLYKDTKLISWLFICEAGFLTHLYTVEEERRNNYAEVVVKYVTNDRLKDGKDTFLYVVRGNTNSYRLFEKLDFEIVGEICWMFFKKDNALLLHM